MPKGKDKLHVFLAHSSITYVTIKTVINDLELSDEEVLVLTMRKFEIDDKLTSKEFPGFKIESIYNVLGNKIKLKEFDKFINEVTLQRKFHLYIPHQLVNSFYLLLTHKNCIRYNYIEEGLSHYIPYETINKTYGTSYKTKWHSFFIPKLMSLTFGNRLPAERNIYDCESTKYGHSYGLFEGSFPEFKNRKVVSPNFDSKKLINIDLKHLLVFGAEVESHYLEAEAYINMLTGFLTSFKGVFKAETLFYKWHPSQSDLFKKQITQVLTEGGISIQELNIDVPLESIAFRLNVNFYQLVSASGFYAALMGRKVYSFYQMLETSDQLNEKMDALPKHYFEIIKHPKNLEELEKMLIMDRVKMELES